MPKKQTSQKSRKDEKLLADRKGHDRIVMQWNAIEYIRHEKSRRWYFIALTVLALLLIWSLYSHDWTMALALIVFAIVYYYIHAYHPPKTIEIVISEMGIQVGQEFYPYSHIQAFWIIYEHGLQTLNLRINGQWFSDVVIQLESQDPVVIRQYLVTQIPEWEGKREKTGDMLLRLLKL